MVLCSDSVPQVPHNFTCSAKLPYAYRLEGC